jgi:steroid 5-alpha reductase family enzyme
MNVTQSVLIVWGLAALAQTGGWLWQQKRRNAGIVDAIWAAGLGGAAVLMAWLGDGALWSRTTLALLGGVWGLRLALHLWRRVRGEHEDGRYAHLRSLWGNGGTKWFAFFQFQALLIVLFSLPFLAVARNPVDGPTAWWIAGVALWFACVGGEALADAQLARFRADTANKGKTCRAGLWRYSRHPNYFFEWLHWLSYVLLAVGSPQAWLSWGGPVVMFVFLRWLSGIPFTEAQALRTRGEDYRAYQRSTNMLFPWFPRSEG